MAKKEKPVEEVVESEAVQPEEESLETEDDKLDIEDIKDPLDEIEEPSEKEEPEVDFEDVVEEKEEKSPLVELPEPEVKKKKKGSFFSRKGKESKKEKSVKEKAEKVPEATDEPLFVPKKKKALGRILTVVFTVIVTAAIVLGGVYAYTKYFKPTEKAPETETKEEIRAEEEETPVEKYVYVNSSVGLNLRKEATTVAEILAIIPNGTKIKVLEEDAGWYKVEYDGKEGWVSKEFVTDKNPLVYENTTYGFTLEFPASWSGYKVFEKEVNWGSFSSKTLYIALPTTDKNWTETGITKGYASLMAISPFTKTQWGQLDSNDTSSMNKLAESDTHVITGSSGQATPTDLSVEFKDVATILKTLQLIK